MKNIFITLTILWAANMAYAEGEVKVENNKDRLQVATFASGCFWCIQPSFDKLKGVKETYVGYTGGKKENPTYDEVSSEQTGHAEAIEIFYDPHEVSYEQLLGIFWRVIDPTTLNEQFSDHGTQYRTAIYYHNEEQKQLAQETKKELEKSGRYDKPIVTEITAATKFYPAEDYHQKYYKKSSKSYERYHYLSGRPQYLKKVWGQEAEQH